MPARPDDARYVVPGSRRGAANTRTLVLAGGFALALGATLAVFLTDNPQYLRIAVVAVAWAFVLATFAAGRRSGDRAEAKARESELRHAYELELEREVSARREYELELENELRRETQDAVRDELEALRADVAKLSGLREEVARVASIGGDLRALTGLREEVARVAAMSDDVARVASMRDDVKALSGLRDDVTALHAIRDDVAGLASLRHELGQVAELRAEMGRLRAELTEQLSSEMLVERIVMRTQASRLPGEPSRLDQGSTRALDGASNWADDVPPRELTGGWPAVRLDEPRETPQFETQQFEQVRVDRTTSRPPVPTPEPAPSWETPSWDKPSWENPSWGKPSWDTPSWEKPSWDEPSREAPRTGWTSAPLPPVSSTPPPPETSVLPSSPLPPGAAGLSAPLSADRWSPSVDADLTPHRSRHSAAHEAVSRAPEPELPPRRRRSDEPTAAPVPIEYAPTTQRPAVSPRPSPAPRPAPPVPNRPETVARPEFDRTAFRFATPDPAPSAPNPDLARILAENGTAPAPGGRRRRRYRDDGDADDVLSRVLRGE
jgi:hypothetical protein